jgi:hypothetical protein
VLAVLVLVQQQTVLLVLTQYFRQSLQVVAVVQAVKQTV